MRTWNLKSDDPLSLTLAADARMVATDYCNDHIWELVLAGSDPPAVALQTTFGLRARSFRLFPRFIEAGMALSDPGAFIRPVTIHLICPNYVRLSYTPFIDIEIEAEYWASDSHGVTGRLKLLNRGVNSRTIRIEWAAVLNPLAKESVWHPSKWTMCQS